MCFFSIFTQILIEHSVVNSGDPGQTLHFVASDLDLHCLSMSQKMDARLILINMHISGWPKIYFRGLHVRIFQMTLNYVTEGCFLSLQTGQTKIRDYICGSLSSSTLLIKGTL